MASAGKTARLTSGLVRTRGNQRPGQALSREPVAAKRPTIQAPIAEDDRLKPGVGKFSFSERTEPPRPAKSASRIVDKDEEPTAWSKYDGMIARAAAPAKGTEAPKVEDDDDNFIWSKYGEPIRRGAAARKPEPAAALVAQPPASARTVAAIEAKQDVVTSPPPFRSAEAPIAWTPQPAEFASLASIDGSFRAAWLDAGRGMSLVLPRTKPSPDAPIDTVQPAGFAAPRLLSWNGEAPSARHVLPAFDPRSALVEAVDGSAAHPLPLPVPAEPETVPELLTLAAPQSLRSDERETAPFAPPRDDDGFANVPALAALRASFAAEDEASTERISLALPRQLLLSIPGAEAPSALRASGDSPVYIQPADRPPAASAAPPTPETVRAPGTAPLTATPTLSLSAQAHGFTGYRMDTPDFAALRSLRLSLDLEQESAGEPATLAAPRLLPFAQGDRERSVPSDWLAFDPLAKLTEPTEAAPAPVVVALPEPAVDPLLALAEPVEPPPLEVAPSASLEPGPGAALVEAIEPPSAEVTQQSRMVAETQAEPIVASAQPVAEDEAGELATSAVETSAEPVVAAAPEADEQPASRLDTVLTPSSEAAEEEQASSVTDPALAAAIEEPTAHAIESTVEPEADEVPAPPTAEFASESEPPETRPAEAPVAAVPDPDDERRAAIAALTDQLSSVIGSVLENKEYATAATRPSRGSPDPGIGSRKGTPRPATQPPANDKSARRGVVVSLPPRRPAPAKRSGSWAAMAATLAAMVIASGLLSYELNAMPEEAPSRPAPQAKVAAAPAPASLEPALPSIASLEPQESSQLVLPINSDSSASDHKPNQKRPRRP